MGESDTQQPADDADGFTIEHIQKRRGRPALPRKHRLEPFTVRLTERDVEGLHARWRAEQNSGRGTMQRFSAWLRTRLISRD